MLIGRFAVNLKVNSERIKIYYNKGSKIQPCGTPPTDYKGNKRFNALRLVIVYSNIGNVVIGHLKISCCVIDVPTV